MYEIYTQISFLSRHFILGGGHLRFGKIYFPLVDMYYLGDRLRLAILHLGKYSIHTYMLHVLCHFSELLNCTLVTIVATATVEADCDPCEVHCDRILMLFY